MPTWWYGSFRGVYLGGTLPTPGVERVVPYWWLAPGVASWNTGMDDLVYPLQAVER